MRIQLRFSKTEAMRFTGHLDLHHAWERTFRRARLPIAYSQGFHPQPRINLACALPLGFTSECELAEFWLAEPLPLQVIAERLRAAAPPGIQIHTIEEITGRLPALQTRVQSAEYTITFLDDVPGIETRIRQLLDAPTLPRQRRGKAYDLRPLIEAIGPIGAGADGKRCCPVQLAAREGATGRPEELLEALGVPAHTARIHRTALALTPPPPQPDRAAETG